MRSFSSGCTSRAASTHCARRGRHAPHGKAQRTLPMARPGPRRQHRPSGPPTANRPAGTTESPAPEATGQSDVSAPCEWQRNAPGTGLSGERRRLRQSCTRGGVRAEPTRGDGRALSWSGGRPSHPERQEQENDAGRSQSAGGAAAEGGPERSVSCGCWLQVGARCSEGALRGARRFAAWGEAAVAESAARRGRVALWEKGIPSGHPARPVRISAPLEWTEPPRGAGAGGLGMRSRGAALPRRAGRAPWRALLWGWGGRAGGRPWHRERVCPLDSASLGPARHREVVMPSGVGEGVLGGSATRWWQVMAGPSLSSAHPSCWRAARALAWALLAFYWLQRGAECPESRCNALHHLGRVPAPQDLAEQSASCIPCSLFC